MEHAREKFTINQTVRATAKHPDCREGKPAREGIVRGFGVNQQAVRVQVNGLRSVESYHMDFWEPVK